MKKKNSTNNYCSNINNKQINFFIVISIIIFISIIVLSNVSNVGDFTQKYLSSNKMNNKSKTNIIEPFIEPKIYNTPRNFELYKVDKDLGTISFIFSTPMPHIIGNLSDEYILVLNSYRQFTAEENTEFEESYNDKNSSKPANILQFIETKLTIRKLKDLESNDDHLVRQGKHIFKINIPSEDYKYYDANDEEKTLDITYKAGLIAKYPNIYSKVAICENKLNGFNLKDSFDYLDNKIRKELGVDYTSQNKPKINTELDDNLVSLTEISHKSKYEQLKDQLGDYPMNLILNEQTGIDSLDYLLKQSPHKYNLNINMNFKDLNEPANTMQEPDDLTVEEETNALGAPPINHANLMPLTEQPLVPPV
jgi:hypothetical protein